MGRPGRRNRGIAPYAFAPTGGGRQATRRLRRAGVLHGAPTFPASGAIHCIPLFQREAVESQLNRLYHPQTLLFKSIAAASRMQLHIRTIQRDESRLAPSFLHRRPHRHLVQPRDTVRQQCARPVSRNRSATRMVFSTARATTAAPNPFLWRKFAIRGTRAARHSRVGPPSSTTVGQSRWHGREMMPRPPVLSRVSGVTSPPKSFVSFIAYLVIVYFFLAGLVRSQLAPIEFFNDSQISAM